MSNYHYYYNNEDNEGGDMSGHEQRETERDPHSVCYERERGV